MIMKMEKEFGMIKLKMKKHDEKIMRTFYETELEPRNVAILLELNRQTVNNSFFRIRKQLTENFGFKILSIIQFHKVISALFSGELSDRVEIEGNRGIEVKIKEI